MDMFGKFGNTFEIDMIGQTNEQQNIQALLVNKFPDFDIGEGRRDNLDSLLGVGLFNADGPVWEHAQAIVRPNLTCKQVADLQLFEMHIRVWMDAMDNRSP